jgi:F5/8 type C domain
MMVAPAAAGGGGTGGHAYWRVLGSKNGLDGNVVAFSAMAFRDDSGASISATGGTAIESSHHSTNAAANLFDGSDPTFWESETSSGMPWVGYHFASTPKVRQIGLQKTASMDSQSPPLLGLFQFSNDGLTWTTIAMASVAAALTSNDTMVWFDFTVNPVITRTDFGAHAWWRVCGSEAGVSSTYCAFSAMAFKDGSGSTITVSGGTAIESGHFSTFGVANLFDGSNPTFWESDQSMVPYAGYHFGSPVTVMQIGLQKAASMDGSTPSLLGIFQYSDDGLTWFDAAIANVSVAMTANDTMYWFDFAGAL